MMTVALVTTADVDLALTETTVLMIAAIATERNVKFTTRRKNATDLAAMLDALLATEDALTDGPTEAAETALVVGDAEDLEAADLAALSVLVATDVECSNSTDVRL
jgi:hypothetical protein